MSDFTAKVTAQLDTSKIPSQLSQLESMISKRKFVITVDTSAAKEINHVKSAYSDLLSLQKRINSTRVKLAGLDANKDKAQISALSGQLNRLMTDYNNLHSTVGRKLSTSQLDNLAKGFDNATAKIATLNAKAADAKGVEKLERSFTRLKDIVSQMGKIQLKINGLDASKNAAEISQLTAQFKDLESQYNRLKTSLKGKIDGVQSSQLSNSLKDMQNQLSQLDAKAQDTKRRLVEAINVKVSDGSLSSSIAKVTKEYERLATTGHSKLTEVKADIEALNQLQAKLGNSSDVDELVANYDKFNATLKKVKNGLSTISSESKTFASSLQISTLDNKIATWMEKNTKAAKTYGKSLDELRAKLAALAGSGSPVPISSVNAIEQEFNSTVQAAVASGKTGKTWSSTFKDSFASIGKYISASTVFYTAIRGLKDMYQNVVNIDSAMVELKKVTNETDESYNTFLKGTNKKAQEIGTTITGLVSSTADFARLGYNFEESQKLAEVANIYAVVGDEIENVDVATESIISTMKAFNINANDSISIVDKFNEVGNNFAISSGGIGEAMKRSASSMAAAGNTIDETIALITAANTVVQNPEKVGTAFKTISMRIRGAKTELEEAGESTEGMAESTAKLQKEIKALSGVDIMKNKDEFKSTYQILDELAQKWGGLTDIQQASIIELLAGKHQGNVMASLMNNFDEAREALAVSMGSDGSAMKEHEKWLDSVEAKQLQLKAAWEGLSQDFLSADFVKLGVDALRGIVNAIDAVVNAIGSLGTVAAGVGAFGLKKFIGAKGLAGVAKAALAIPKPLLAVAAAVAAVGVAVYAVNKHNYNKKFKWAEGMSESAEEIRKYSDELVKLNKLSKEVEDLRLVIESPASSQQDVENAKSRIEEIAELLNQEYNLNIKADASEVEDAINLLTQQTRSEMVDSAETYISKVEKVSGDYKYAKTTYADDKARLDKLSQLNDDYQNLMSQYRLIDWIDGDMDKNIQEADKIYSKWKDIHKTAVELGVNDNEKGVVHLEDLEGLTVDEFTEQDFFTTFFAETNKVASEFNKASKSLPDVSKSIQEFEESSQKASTYLAQALASDVAAGNAYGADTDIALFEKLGKSLQSSSANTDDISKKFAIAKQGVIDLNAAIEAGKLDSVVEEYLNFKNTIGATSRDAVRGAALLKQGFSDASQVTEESISNLYNDMKQLGKDEGVKDYVKNAIEGTSVLAAGFNSVDEAVAAGDAGITKVLSKIKSLNEAEGRFEGLSIKQQSDKLTEFARSMDLIPDDKSVRIDVETGEIHVIDDITAKINEVWGSGDKTLNIRVNTEVNGDDIEDFDKKVEELNNKDCSITFNADGSPARATIGELTYDLHNFDETTGTATLLAEGGEAIGTIDLVNGKIELLPDKKVITFEATYAGIQGLSDLNLILKDLKGRGDLSFNLDVNGNTELLNEAGDIVGRLEKDKNIFFHINADGDLEMINTLNGQIQTLKKNGDITLPVYVETENLGKIEGLKGDLEELNGKKCVVSLSADGTPVVAAIGEANYAIQDYNSKTGTATLTAENGQAIAAIDLTTGKITAIPDKTANVNANVTGTGDVDNLDNAIENTNSKSVTVTATTSGTEKVSWLKSLIDGIKSKVVSVTAKIFGGGDVDGTAHVDGTAFAGGNVKRGDWGKKDSGVALGGELGEELIVRDGKFFTVGSDSAEFFTYQKDDIIFNAEQTKQIFEKGKITHGKRRGRAFSEGNVDIKPVSTSTDKSEKSQFELDYDYHQHLVNTEKETDKEYFDWLKSSYQNAYDTGQIELEEYYKYKEEVYEKSKSLFDDYINDIEHKITLINNQNSKIGLVDDTYLQNIENIYKELLSYNGDGKIDFTIRPKVDTSKLKNAGWQDVVDGEIATVFSSSFSNEDGSKTIVVTPILPNGEVLSPEQLEHYANELLLGNPIDVDINMGMFTGEDSITQAEQFANRIHKLHDEYFLTKKPSDQIIAYYRDIQEKVHAKAEEYRNNGLDDNSETIQELQELWWDAEENILKTITDVYEKAVSSIENTIELAKKHLKDFVTVYDDGSAEEFSGTIVSKYTNIQNKLHEEAEALRALGYAEDSEEIQDLQKQWWDAEENKNDSLREIFDRRLELSDDYIERSKLLGWENGDNEIKARERILAWMQSDYYRSLFESEEEWQEAYLEQYQNYRDTVLSTMDKIYNDYADKIGEINEEIDNQIVKEQALLDVKSKQYEAINKLTEAQHEADKAIADSRISKSYLSDYEYSLIYNEEDYAAVSKVIGDIDEDISLLTKSFNRQIENAYANGQEYLIENITAEYERQVELKMQELAIAQAELEVTKKQTELNNVLAERNIRQLVERNGKLEWEWVADTDKVRAATEALSDAEYEYQKVLDEKNQQINLNRMQENIDDFADEQERNNKLVEELGDTVDDVKKAIDDIENPIKNLGIDIDKLRRNNVASFSAAIDSMVAKLGNVAISSASSAKQTTSSNFQNKGYSYGSGGNSSSRVTYDSSIDYMAQAQSAISRGDDASAQKYLEKRNAKIDGEGLSYKKESLSDVKKKMGYASGTTNATKGWHEVDENGGETYITTDGKFHNFSGGEVVFTAEQTKILYDLANQSSHNYLNKSILKSSNKVSETPELLQTMQNYYDSNDTSFGDAHITINNPANFDEFTRRLINEFKKKK